VEGWLPSLLPSYLNSLLLPSFVLLPCCPPTDYVLAK
jgi:hypothetical protein